MGKPFPFCVKCGRTKEGGFDTPTTGRASNGKGCNGMYVVCKEHVELAIDMFVDEYEDAPDVVDLKETKFSDWDPPVKCKECEKKAEFLVV